MYLPLLLGLLSFVLCFLLTPLCRVVAIRLNLVDKPDDVRKRHAKAVPRVGGFAIVLAYASALGIMLLIAPRQEQLHIQHSSLLRVLLPPAALIFLVGLWDDLFKLSPLKKLAGQIVACMTAAILGRLYAPESFVFGSDGSILTHPWASVAICTFWLVLCTNAINLIDGLDGLASGIGLMGTVATLLLGIYTHNAGLVIATVPLVGALLAFLYYNFNPASIFLGDCGSLTIGFMLGAISLTWENHGGITFGMFAPVTILALPLLDTSISVVRRFLRKKPWFSADEGHIHHVVQKRGHKPKTAALILYAACAVATSLSIVSSFAPRSFRLVFILMFTLMLCIAVRYLDYIEFRALGRVFSSGRVRERVNEEIYLRELDIALSKMESVNDCWEVVQNACRQLNFATAEMFFQNLYFDAVLQEDASERDWWLTLPVGERGYLRVSRSNLLVTGQLVMPALERLQRGLDKWERTYTIQKEQKDSYFQAA